MERIESLERKQEYMQKIIYIINVVLYIREESVIIQLMVLEQLAIHLRGS